MTGSGVSPGAASAAPAARQSTSAAARRNAKRAGPVGTGRIGAQDRRAAARASILETMPYQCAAALGTGATGRATLRARCAIVDADRDDRRSAMFRALLLEKDETGFHARLGSADESALPEGDVLVGVEYSTLNY